MSPDEEHQSIIQAVNCAMGKIREHVDCCHIFVSKYSDDGTNKTICFDAGSGNLMARLGHIRNFLIAEDAKTAHQAAEDEREDE